MIKRLLCAIGLYRYGKWKHAIMVSSKTCKDCGYEKIKERGVWAGCPNEEIEND